MVKKGEEVILCSVKGGTDQIPSLIQGFRGMFRRGCALRAGMFKCRSGSAGLAQEPKQGLGRSKRVKLTEAFIRTGVAGAEGGSAETWVIIHRREKRQLPPKWRRNSFLLRVQPPCRSPGRRHRSLLEGRFPT
jgi:hypothetical protein